MIDRVKMDSSSEVDVDDIRYCERFMQLMIDLEALLPTRYGSDRRETIVITVR